MLNVVTPVVEALWRASPTYDPATFSLTRDLVPMVQSLDSIAGMLDKLRKYYSIGFSL